MQADDAGEGGADQSAVKDEAAVLNHEHFGKGRIGEFSFPIGGDVNETGAQDGANHDPEGKIGDDLAGNIFAAGAAGGGQQPGQEAKRDHDAIPANGQATELNCYGMHGKKYWFRERKSIRLTVC